MIRPVTLEDREWVLDVAEKTYTVTRFGFNREDAAKSFDAMLNHKNIIFLRGKKTFFFGCIEPFMCNFKTKDATMQLLVGEGNSGMEPVHLIKEAMRWAKNENAQVLEITTTTEHGFGEKIMASLGARKRIIYDIPLNGEYNVK